MFTGIDWAADEHAVCVIDAAGRVADRFTISHTAEGFEHLIGRLARHGHPAELPIAIERPDGRLVDRLLAAGHPVVPVKTTAIKAWREAEVGSGAKSDPGDAQVIADYLRLRRPDLRELRPFSAETRALRAVVRTRTDLVDARIATGNQLAAALAAFWPGAGELFADVWSEIALAFLERYPTPTAAAHLGEARMAAFLRKHGYSGRRGLHDRARAPGAAAGLQGAQGSRCHRRALHGAPPARTRPSGSHRGGRGSQHVPPSRHPGGDDRRAARTAVCSPRPRDALHRPRLRAHGSTRQTPDLAILAFRAPRAGRDD